MWNFSKAIKSNQGRPDQMIRIAYQQHWNTPHLWNGHIGNASAGRRCKFSNQLQTGEDLVQSYVKAAKDHDLLIAEVGVWRNPVSPFEDVRTDAIEYAVGQLRLADSIGANCAVNVAGSMGNADGAYKDNFTKET